MSKISLGHHVFGLVSAISGVFALSWHDVKAWNNVMPLGRVPHPQIFLYVAGAMLLLGGLTIHWRATRRVGALSLASLYLVFAVLWLPEIVASPRVYNSWGAPMYELSLFSGALIVYGMMSPNNPGAPKLARIGYVLFGVCVVSFTIEQFVYFSPTLALVPKWIPPGTYFWAVATTIFFGLAAVALLSGCMALLAARLLAIMLIAFGFLIWVPAVVSNPHRLFNWTEHNQNLAIAAAAWIVADFLAQSRSRVLPAP